MTLSCDNMTKQNSFVVLYEYPTVKMETREYEGYVEPSCVTFSIFSGRRWNMTSPSLHHYTIHIGQITPIMITATADNSQFLMFRNKRRKHQQQPQHNNRSSSSGGGVGGDGDGSAR